MSMAEAGNLSGMPMHMLGIMMANCRHAIGCTEPNTIAYLTDQGCEFEQAGVDQYRLLHAGLEVWQDYIEFSMTHAGLVPPKIRVYKETSSTQDAAKAFGRDRTLVIADQQTAGRGRLGRTWASNPGANVLMSLAWPVPTGRSTHDRLSMQVGVAIAQAVERLVPNGEVRIKWPNDILIGGRKLAGVLIERTPGVFIIGIGINVLPNTDAALSGNATSLTEHRGSPHQLHAITEIAIKLLAYLDHRVLPEVVDEWRSRASLGQTQTFEQAGQRITGEVMDLDPDHGLIIRRETGEIVTLPAATTSVVK